MKKSVFLTLFIAYSMMVAAFDGMLPGKFSVNAQGKQVRFSQGNLQYNAGNGEKHATQYGTAKGTWRFADHQYTAVGTKNTNIDENYRGWIDLFGWGADGNNGCEPWLTEISPSKYGVYNYPRKDITGTSYDWGIFNAISNGGDITNCWRTLTADEWNYLINRRDKSKRGRACIGTQNGFVLLPDDWNLPEGLSFNADSENFSSNTYTVEQWNQMEQAGAVFLPAAGGRSVSAVTSEDRKKLKEFNERGTYWSTTAMESTMAVWFTFTATVTLVNSSDRDRGFSVRLVRDVPVVSFAKEKELTGLFSVNDTTKIIFSQGNLQYLKGDTLSHQTAEGTDEGIWQFAQEQYSMVGVENTEIETGEYWIDLFGWGTSGYNGKSPLMTSDKTEDYGDGYNDIAGTYYDWGIYNAISNGGNQPGMWRTLTRKEWRYLLFERENANLLCGPGKLKNVKGIYLLPDDWDLEERPFVNGFASWDSCSISENVVWKTWEEAGAVFLPAAGNRQYRTRWSDEFGANYWSASYYNVYAYNAFAYIAHIDAQDTDTLYMKVDYGNRSFGNSVRLVRDAQEEKPVVGLDNIKSEKQTRKVLIDNKLYIILNDGKRFNAIGQRIK